MGTHWVEEVEDGPSVSAGPKEGGCLMVVLGAFILPLLAVLARLA